MRKLLLISVLTLLFSAALTVRPAHADTITGTDTVLAYEDMNCSFTLPAAGRIVLPGGATVDLLPGDVIHGLGPGEYGVLAVRFGMAHLDVQNGNLTFDTTCRGTLTATTPYTYVGNAFVHVYGTFQGGAYHSDLDHFIGVETWSDFDTGLPVGWTQQVVEAFPNGSCFNLPVAGSSSSSSSVPCWGAEPGVITFTSGTSTTSTSPSTSPLGCNPSRRTFACNCEGIFFNPAFCNTPVAGPGATVGVGENEPGLGILGVSLYNAQVAQSTDFTFTIGDLYYFYYASGTVLGNLAPPYYVPSTDEIHAVVLNLPSSLDFFENG